MKKVVYVLGINDGFVVFESRESLMKWFEKLEVKELKFEDEEVMSVESGIDFLIKFSEKVVCKNEELFEMGDDYCELSLGDYEVN